MNDDVVTSLLERCSQCLGVLFDERTMIDILCGDHRPSANGLDDDLLNLPWQQLSGTAEVDSDTNRKWNDFINRELISS